jgi:hypothetical protein
MTNAAFTGSNFGVVTRFDYQLHPFDRNVLSGIIMWPIGQAREVLDFYGDWYSGLSDDLYVGPVMLTTPDGTSVFAMIESFVPDPRLAMFTHTAGGAVTRVDEMATRVPAPY